MTKIFQFSAMKLFNISYVIPCIITKNIVGCYNKQNKYYIDTTTTHSHWIACHLSEQSAIKKKQINKYYKDYNIKQVFTKNTKKNNKSNSHKKRLLKPFAYNR